jgi:tetratricopeptide (TPR) repeat protein
MKKANVLLFILLCAYAIFGCKPAGEKDARQSTDLISIRTLGLAYLEEFKLEEAEKEFLRFIKLAPGEKLGYANLGLTYLRMGKYPEAEKQLFKALEIDPQDPDIRLILATVYQMNEEPEKAIAQLKEGLGHAPDHLKTLYQLTEVYATRSDETSLQARENYMRILVEKAPGNLVPRLNLTDMYVRQGKYDQALEQLEILRKQFPEFHKDADEYYDKTLAGLRNKDKDKKLLSNFIIFHNYLKVTTPYQAGILDLKGPGGSLIGFPVISFSQQALAQTIEFESLIDAVKFTDASSTAGLDIISTFGEGQHDAFKFSTHVTTGDYDGDGDIDLYAGSYDPQSSTYRHYLFNNELGRLKEVTDASGLRHTGKELSAVFTDYDNDGFLDLYILREGGNLLYKNNGKGGFDEVTAKAGIGSKAGTNLAVFCDLDHDGDLDIYTADATANRLLRNNADGSFQDESARMGLSANNLNSTGAVFGDFDEDGDLDLFVVNENTGSILYSNQRQGAFKDVAAETGLKDEVGSGSVTAGDYDNDGYLDLFITPVKPGNPAFYRNLRNGTFEKKTSLAAMFSALQEVRVHDVDFMDIDNDGYLDLCIAGESTRDQGRGFFLYHNDTKGGFADVSHILPEGLRSGRQIAVLDYNDDGDLDILLAGLNGGVHLLRNDGGNTGHYINMKLMGLRTGSAKNNYFGIGAKVELRSGDLYQSKVVTDPNVHFGIGKRTQADVIRITWTNGVPQNIFSPQSDQSLVEEQMLKGSCPFLYTWNGEEYVFVKDIMWRSALGMPLGIMGGSTAYAFADASDDYLKIPGEMLKTNNGVYSIQVTAELWETIYLDQVQLVAVDHPESIDIFVAEQFSPPPFPEYKVYPVREKRLPVSARNGMGNDVLPFIQAKDDNYLSDFKPDRYQGITEMQELILDPGPWKGADSMHLFLNGWIFPTDASINVALSQSEALKVAAPVVQVLNRQGEWITVVENMGFPMGKDKTVVVDLTGKFLSSDHRIRIKTNMEIYWDHIFFAEVMPEVPLVSNILEPAKADLHYRGFSRSYRKGGRYGPHWFDYASVDKNPRWRDLTGSYTRYGNVLPLLTASDNRYIITNAGDETSVQFSASGLPPVKPGWKRDFLIRSVGWVKDGDLNTALGQTVEPLPFHGMSAYPPASHDVFPDNAAHRRYMREYNTRKVDPDSYIRAFHDLKN